MKAVAPVDLNGFEVRNMLFQQVATDPVSPAEGMPWYNTAQHQWKIRLNGSTLALGDALAAKAPLASPALTGTPTAPTAAPGTSTTQLSTTEFVALAISAAFAANDYQTIKGGLDCSANPNYPAANAGDTYRVTVAGKIGGGSGPNVEIGDTLICFTDGTAGGTQASVGANWIVLQSNIDGAVTLTGTQTLTNKTLTSPVINSPTGITTANVTEVTNLYFTDERAQDAIAALFAAGSHTGITFTYNDAGNAISASVTGGGGGGGTVNKYSATVGNGSLTSFTINQSTHGLAANSQLFVAVSDATTGEVVYADITVAPASGNVTIAFGVAPTTNQYRVTIIG